MPIPIPAFLLWKPLQQICKCLFTFTTFALHDVHQSSCKLPRKVAQLPNFHIFRLFFWRKVGRKTKLKLFLKSAKQQNCKLQYCKSERDNNKSRLSQSWESRREAIWDWANVLRLPQLTVVECHALCLFWTCNDYKKTIIFALYFICCQARWTAFIYQTYIDMHTYTHVCVYAYENGFWKTILKALNLCRPLLTFMRFASPLSAPYSILILV